MTLSMPAKLEAMLAREGLAGAAKSLNQTVPHRYTAIFLRDGASLRNVALFDKADPTPPLWPPFQLSQSFCSIVVATGKPIELREARTDSRVEVREHPAAKSWQSYCGVPLIDAEGNILGVLCHFDAKPCEAAIDLEQMLEMPALLLPYLQSTRD